MATMIRLDGKGNIVTSRPAKALVRFPTEAEQAKGMTEVPRSTRVKEYQSGNKARS
jgi:hypothetical protein